LKLLFELSSVLMFLAALPVALRDGHMGFIVLSIFVGIAGAVVATAIYYQLVTGVDQNQFPFGIAIFAAFGVPGALVGLAIGWSIRQHRRDDKNDQSPN
jgi:uncharacterized membrane protein YeaQ/YmgE (transglycosylase-associated protein family)